MKNRLQIGFRAIAAFTIVCAALPAQTKGTAAAQRPRLPELDTDRPDFTESTGVVGPGVFQFENGFTMERDRDVRSLSGGELLMRVGLSRRVELRFGADGFLTQWSAGEENTSGFSDIELATKIKLFEQGRFRPALSVIPVVSMPTGSGPFSSRGFDPTLKVSWSKDLGRAFTLGGNLNVSSLTTENGRFVQRALSCSLGHDLAAGFEGYWEVFSFSPWDKGASAAWIVNTGITHKVGRNAQIDARAGKRMTDAGPNWFFGMGVAIRRPTTLLAR